MSTLDPKVRKPSIIDGKYANTSPSQANTFVDCNRKWMFEKLGLKTPEHPSATFGKRVHKALEQFANNEEYDPLLEPHVSVTKNVIAGINIDATEHEISMPTYPGGPTLNGVIDVLSSNRIIDYKTKSSFRYALTPGQMLENTQLNIYAKWWYSQDFRRSTEWVDLWLVYILATDKPKAMLVNVTTNLDGVNKVWERDLITIRKMSDTITQHYEVPKDDDHIDQIAMRVAPNTNHCSAYGGCHFRSRCGLGAESPLTMKWLKKPSDLVQIKKPLDTSVHSDVHSTNTGDNRVTTLKDKLMAKKAATAPANGSTAPQPTGKSLEEKLATSTAPVTAAEISILDTKLAELGTMVEAMPDATVTAVISIVPPDAPADVVSADAPVQTTTVEPPVAAKRGPGRPKKAESASLIPSGMVVGSRPVEQGTPTTGLHLYIDCFPVKGVDKNYVLAEDWLRPIVDQMAIDAGQNDWRLIDKFTSKPQLAIAVRARMHELPSALVVMSFAAGSDVLMECLIPYATAVTRGK